MCWSHHSFGITSNQYKNNKIKGTSYDAADISGLWFLNRSSPSNQRARLFSRWSFGKAWRSAHSLYKWVSAVTPDKSVQQANDLIAAKSEILRRRVQLHRTEEDRDLLKKVARYIARKLEWGTASSMMTGMNTKSQRCVECQRSPEQVLCLAKPAKFKTCNSRWTDIT